MRQRGLAEAAAVVAGALLLTAALTYPLVARIDRVGRVNTADGHYAMWNVAWVADSLIVDPSRLFDANIFYPARRALAFSEANIGAGVIAVPAWGFSGNPFLAHNSVVLFAFTMGVAGAYYLTRYLTASREAAAVAGLLFAFCPFVFARTAHIQLMMTFGLPFSMLAFHRLVDRLTPGRAATLGVVLWAQALSCAYYGIFAALMVGLGTLVFAVTRGLWRSPRYWSHIALAAVVSIALTAPFFLPYVQVQEDGFSRTLDDARQYSANAGAWLASSSWAHRWWLRYIDGFSEVLFPGILATALGVWGAAAVLRPRREPEANAAPGLTRDVAGYYLAVALIAFWASFGPDAGLYRVLYDTVPVFAFLRAPARIGIVVTLALVVLGSGVLAPWLRRQTRPRGPGRRPWPCSRCSISTPRRSRPCARPRRCPRPIAASPRCLEGPWPSSRTSTSGRTFRVMPSTCSARPITSSRSSTATRITFHASGARRSCRSVRFRRAKRSPSSDGSMPAMSCST